MKTLIKTKLLEGKYAELRDYELFKDMVKVIHCVGLDYKSCSHENDQYMFLSIAQQKKGVVTNTQKSQFYPYKYYKLYKYLWKPYRQTINDNVSIDYTALAKVKLPDNWEETRRLLHK